MSKWNIKIAFSNKTIPTSVVEDTFDNVIKIIKKSSEEDDFVGVYIQKSAD